MKISVRQLVKIHQSLLQLSEVKTDIWYAISKNKAKTKRPFEDYLQVERDCVDKLALKDETGNLVLHPETGNFVFNTDADAKEFDTKLSECQSEEVEIDFYTVKITDAFKSESHAASLIEPLIDIILIE